MNSQVLVSLPRLLETAAEQAFLHGDDYIGTEHVLLALVQDPQAQTGALFEHVGLAYSRVLGMIDRISTERIEPVRRLDVNTLSMTPAVKRVLDWARDRQEKPLSGLTDPRQLLVALAREPSGLARIVLRQLGANFCDCHDATELLEFSAGMRLTFENATRRAIQLQHQQLETQHMLLGLIDAGGEGVRILKSLDSSPARLFWDTHNAMSIGPVSAPLAMPLPWSLRLKYAIAMARSAAFDVNAACVNTAHLLMALAQPSSGLAAEMLKAAGVTAAAVRELFRIEPLCDEHREREFHEMDDASQDVRDDADPQTERGGGDRSGTGRAAHAHSNWNSDSRLSVRLRRVLELAESIAVSLRHRCIGAEHLLIALANGPGGIAQDALTSFSVDGQAALREIARSEFLSPRDPRVFRMPTSLVVHKLIARAEHYSDVSKNGVIDTGHLLQALVDSGAIASFLAAKGIDPSRLNGRMRAIRGSGVSRESEVRPDEPGGAGRWLHDLLGALQTMRTGVHAFKAELQTAATTRCPICNQPNPTVARFCCQCGRQITAA